MMNSGARVDSVERQIARAVKLLQDGELVALPTETVYGLGADASNPVALAKIFAAKGRPADHPLIVHIADAAHLGHWAREIPDAAYKLAAAFWPGPLTLILKKQATVVDLVSGGQDTLGLRVPNHPLALQLLSAFNDVGGKGVAAPSANRFGRISPTTRQHVIDEMGNAVALVLDGGPCSIGIESTIVDLTRGAPIVLRPGMISASDIARVLELDPHSSASGGPLSLPPSPRVSGSLDSHYAPTTPMRLVSAEQLAAEIKRCLQTGQRSAVLSAKAPPVYECLQWRLAASQPDQYAHDLYANLRALDQAGANVILVEALPQTPEWLAIRDRLGRAASDAGA